MGSAGGEAGERRVPFLRDLGLMPAVAVGMRVLVDEDEHVYVSVGNTTSEIMERLGWTQGNIWMPELAETHIITRHRTFPDPIGAAGVVLTVPSGVYQDRREAGHYYFITDASVLRQADCSGVEARDMSTR